MAKTKKVILAPEPIETAPFDVVSTTVEPITQPIDAVDAIKTKIQIVINGFPDAEDISLHYIDPLTELRRIRSELQALI